MSSLKDACKNFVSKSKELISQLDEKSKSIELENDAIADKAFFAFLQDCMNDWAKGAKQGILNDEMQENANLTNLSKEKSFDFISNFLSKTNKFGDKEKEGINAFLSTADGKDFATSLFAKKMSAVVDFLDMAKEKRMDDEQTNKGLSNIVGIKMNDITDVAKLATKANPIGISTIVAESVTKQVLRQR